MKKPNHILYYEIGEKFYTMETKRHREIIRKIKKGEMPNPNKDDILYYDN